MTSLGQEPPGGRVPGQEHDEPTRTGLGAAAIRQAFLDNLFYVQGRYPGVAAPSDNYLALAYTVRDRLLHRWIPTAQTYKRCESRTVCFLSAEYLPGPHLANNLLSLGIVDATREALDSIGIDLDLLISEEEEPGLGNGGLGRLAACFMDSAATLELPAIGYGIRYEFGIFDQAIKDGWQVERSDTWLRYGNPWELRRPNICIDVKIGGRTESYTDAEERFRVRWLPDEVVRGVAYDTPILGHGVNNTNLLRLWRAESTESFDVQAFNSGDYYGAVDRQVRSETLTKVLYPNDEPEVGKRLRLLQQHFFVSCALADMVRILERTGTDIERLHEKYVVQLNDTHPAIAVAELMRLLVDEYAMGWDSAWNITTRMIAYTNHTLLPEALETWPVPLFGQLLPRHLEIIYEINRRFLDQVRLRYPHDETVLARLSIIDDKAPGHVRMAHLACVGAFAVNGVAALHTQLLGATVLKEFHALWPERFSNKTNGVTPRRFVMLSNPGLSRLLTHTIGDGWSRDMARLRDLEAHVDDPEFQSLWRAVKRDCKLALARYVHQHVGIRLDVESIFDVQAKRIHEYKRPHLNVLHIIALYNRIKNEPTLEMPSRSFLFAGKAAPGYFMAKLLIKLIHSVAEVIDRDPDVAGRLKVVFIPDFSVSVGQRVYPAADLSEQISTAGMEASGTGNMKFMMNGAVTLGTLDGANIEIREEVGAENFFLFGCTAAEAVQKRAGGYRPRSVYENNVELRGALDLLAGGYFSHGDAGLFKPLVDGLLEHDRHLVLADFQSYLDTQTAVSRAWGDPGHWTRMSILNVARSGRFSSDRAVREYCGHIWRLAPVPIHLD